ncbi:anti-sigma factor [Belnapia rosea]|uniref:Anti-sigma-K factor RskA n=1 Tax=Belnapia rosea TaxID=938405 RepID=A0A1G6JYF7_9PROT|nr:anti-sigma factor [Belnapia rosea]SDC23792.1 Anti-sigma-K factor RskA [Belnapia rosea]
MIPTDPQERDILAGEYVLGTLDARAAAELEAALPADAALRTAVRAWEARLGPLTQLAEAEAPPAGLWDRIEAALPGAARPAAARSAARYSRWLDPWRGWAIGASAVAAGLAALLVTRPAPEPARLMTVLLTQRDQPAWVVEASPSGTLRLASLNPRQLEPDRAMQLWALPPGATAPTSLGLIPPEGRLTVSAASIRPEPGMLIEISLEPPGGSPTGRPTGPILFIGRLTAAGSS